jgi:hypothetical protein
MSHECRSGARILGAAWQTQVPKKLPRKRYVLYQNDHQTFIQIGNAGLLKSRHRCLHIVSTRNSVMIEETLDMQLTRHAAARCSQRGVRHRVIDLVLRFADIEIPARLGRTQIQLSRIAVVSMLEEGVSVSEADAARHLALIMDGAGVVITVLKLGQKDRRIRGKRLSSGRKGRRRQ